MDGKPQVEIAHSVVDGVYPVSLGRLRSVAIRLVGHPCTYYVRAGRTDEGPVLLGLAIIPDDGTELTAELLKRIPAKRLAHQAALFHVEHGDDHSTEEAAPLEFDPGTYFTEPERRRPGARGRPPRTTSDLQDLAAVHRAARRNGTSARQAIALHLGITPAGADKVIRQLQDAGLVMRRRQSPKKGTPQ
ncbi:hypothetical protein [Gordonia jacobaea]|uniref:hypothetical protein n=1 Tax=Gordonia jacobaea TaxID=122202 RepID=UPI003D7411D7